VPLYQPPEDLLYDKVSFEDGELLTLISLKEGHSSD